MTTTRRDRILGGALVAVLTLVGVMVAWTHGGGDGPDPHATAHVTGHGGTQTVDVRLGDMTVTPGTITVAAGSHLVLRVTNADVVRHDLSVDGGPTTPLLSHGQTATLDVGTVDHDVHAWCTVAGHKAAGMTLTVAVTGGHPDGATPTASTTTTSPAIDFGAAPGPGWKPYDPALRPASGGTVHRVTLTVRDVPTEVAPGVTQTLWTYDGTAPGPILHGHVGDRFVVTLVNGGDMDHSVDFHAGSLAPDEPMRSIAPGESLTYEFTATYAGAWLYHCATEPMSLHVANGMFGAVIIDPPGLDRVDRELVLVQSELYLGAQDGIADGDKIAARAPDAVVFNGYADQYVHAPIQLKAGDRVRVWVVDAGPALGTSFHVVGAQFDTVFKEGAYLLRRGNAEHGAAQTLDLAPAQGGFVELTLKQAGHYTFLDHDMVSAEHGAQGVLEVTAG